MRSDDFTLDDFDEGDRVELSPETDAWMQGDRFGAVIKVGRKWVYVRMDRSQRVLRLSPRYIYERRERVVEGLVEACERCRVRPIADEDAGLCEVCTAYNEGRVVL